MSAKESSMEPPPPNQMSAPQNRELSAGPARVEETVAERFPSFEADKVLVNPYHDELKRDAEYQAQLHKMLLELILKFHAWSTSRPQHESETASDKLYTETQTVQSVEKEQELKRVRLMEFITRIKSALAALTGIGL